MDAVIRGIIFSIALKDGAVILVILCFTLSGLI